MKFKKMWLLYLLFIYFSACSNSTTGGVVDFDGSRYYGLDSNTQERFNCPSTDNVKPVYKNYELGLVGQARVCQDKSNSNNLLITNSSLFYQAEVCIIPLYFDATTGNTFIYPSTGGALPFQMLCHNIDQKGFGTEYKFEAQINAVFVVEGGTNALQLQNCLAKGNATLCPGAKQEIDTFTHDPKYYSFGRLDYNRL